MNKSIEFSERFLKPADRAKAVCELESLGEDAIPILRTILDGTAKNKFQVSYNKLGMPVECSLVVIQRLGKAAKDLEPFVEQWLERGHPYAQEALHEINT
ncbi:hypothetical protein [Marinomonas aquiplantarum]|uniref:Uncharacterized protein n=1 Tax=Marinomonas aquiplantarum TaxID=491951 RepID=A0A366CXA4_9GAMM|nr:hypothetical protein [Marinomonas aquiplantarum]RBO81859.1 hypothetical protein DFP76_1072 [Marinomonas aquiplantarum]|tara:strand:+ start:733 stop:1032 length:300 start_codon:yes stop_codon:yes gene_type:complete